MQLKLKPSRLGTFGLTFDKVRVLKNWYLICIYFSGYIFKRFVLWTLRIPVYLLWGRWVFFTFFFICQTIDFRKSYFWLLDWSKKVQSTKSSFFSQQYFRSFGWWLWCVSVRSRSSWLEYICPWKWIGFAFRRWFCW